MTGRTRRVRQKQEQQEESAAEVYIDAEKLMDLAITAAVSAVISTAVSKSIK